MKAPAFQELRPGGALQLGPFMIKGVDRCNIRI